jgi:hypothetical protein
MNGKLGRTTAVLNAYLRDSRNGRNNGNGGMELQWDQREIIKRDQRYL